MLWLLNILMQTIGHVSFDGDGGKLKKIHFYGQCYLFCFYKQIDIPSKNDHICHHMNFSFISTL
jgi:hypothetical protein